ncbi:MAG: N(4)-(beta-N-acetylglucosaminyl)-L-asparaginase, partial [Holophagales bacterium]|nr:N(4)-(beta-N-acetylglucosaminyl)-L-asparaginase [Holophagales bacterium]
MTNKLNRREFMAATTAAIAGAATSRVLKAQTPTLAVSKGISPVVIASSNGHQFKNGGDVTCVERAFRMMTEGSDVLDSLIAGVNIVELDPLDYSVGYGGLPNADGVVQLDSSCMHGPKKRAGAVACIEGVRTPSLVAQKVMDLTDHHLIVGKGAQDFARLMGFKIEDDLNTPKSRQLWMEWKRRTDPEHWLDPEKRLIAGYSAGISMVADGLIDRDHYFGTINCDGINSRGEICGVTTTSGLAWKIPGRVGDSPILGAGLYVENKVGAAGSTGRGEANLYGLSSFLIVELMRQGRHPKDAGIEALRRIAGNTVDKRLRDAKGQPNFQVIFYALNAKGEYAGTSMFPTKYAICTENGGQLPDTATLYS